MIVTELPIMPTLQVRAMPEDMEWDEEGERHTQPSSQGEERDDLQEVPYAVCPIPRALCPVRYAVC